MWRGRFFPSWYNVAGICVECGGSGKAFFMVGIEIFKGGVGEFIYNHSGL